MAISPVLDTAAQTCEWRQVSPLEHRRPLYANEIFLAVKSLFDGTCTMITSLTITGASISNIDAAWIQLAMTIPLVRMQLLRCKTEEKDELEFSYTVPEHGQHSLKEWKSRTYKPFRELSRHRLQEKAIEGRNELRPCGDNGHSDVAHLYASQDHSGIHLVFSFQHAVADARGQWSIIDRYLALCSRELVLDSANYQWGLDDVAKLPRPFHQAAGLRQDRDIPPFNALDMIHKHIADDAHKVPFAGLPVIPDSVPSAPVETAPPIWTITINSEDYKLLHAEAKRNICTASAWVGAVLTLLMYELNDVEGMRTIRFPLQPVDARRYMLLEDAQRYHGVAIGGGNVDMTDLGTIQAASADLKKLGKIPPSFWAVAKEYKEGLQKLMDDKDSVLAAKEVVATICPFVLADPKIGDMSSIFYTSLGRAQSYFQAHYGSALEGVQVEIVDLATFPVFHNTQLLMCSLMEFKGDLKILYQIPSNTHSQAFAQTFAKRFQEILNRLIDGVQC